jgi:hypothetical protein
VNKVETPTTKEEALEQVRSHRAKLKLIKKHSRPEPEPKSFRQRIGPAMERFGADVSGVVKGAVRGARKVNSAVQKRHRGNNYATQGFPRMGNPFGDFAPNASFPDIVNDTTPKKRGRRNQPFDYVAHMNTMPESWKRFF